MEDKFMATRVTLITPCSGQIVVPVVPPLPTGCPNPVYFGRADSTNTFTLLKPANSTTSPIVSLPREGSYEIKIYFANVLAYTFVAFYDMIGHEPETFKIDRLWSAGFTTDLVKSQYRLTMTASSTYSSAFCIRKQDNTLLEYQIVTGLKSSFSANDNCFALPGSFSTFAAADAFEKSGDLRIEFKGIDKFNRDPVCSITTIPCLGNNTVDSAEIFIPNGTDLNTSYQTFNNLHITPGLYDIAFMSKTSNLGTNTGTWNNYGVLLRDIDAKQLAISPQECAGAIRPIFTFCGCNGNAFSTDKSPSCVSAVPNNFAAFGFFANATQWPSTVTATTWQGNYFFFIGTNYVPEDSYPYYRNHPTLGDPNYGPAGQGWRWHSTVGGRLFWLVTTLSRTASGAATRYAKWKAGITDGFDIKIVFTKVGGTT